MQQNIKKTFEYDKESKEFVIHIKAESPIKLGDKQFGIDKTTTEQRWSAEGIDLLQAQLAKQLSDTENSIRQAKAQLKQLGNFSEREVQNLVKFREKLEKTQKLAKKEKLEDQIKSQEQIIKKLTADIKEVKDGVTKSKSG